MTILKCIHQAIDSPLQRKTTRPMTMWLHTAISDLLYSSYHGSSDGAVQSEITDVTKMDYVSAKDRADAISKALMPPEKDPFGIVAEMFEVVIDLDCANSTRFLVTEIAPFTSTYGLTNGDLFDA